MNKRTLSAWIGLALSLSAMAIPAKTGKIEYTQANGETITIYQHGDEYEHWVTNEDGERIVLNEEGNYVLYTPENHNQEQAAPRRSRKIAEAIQTAVPLNISPRGLVILVSYADKPFTVDYNEMHEMINGENYTRTYRRNKTEYVRNGSARKYFIDQSWGQYQPQFDVVGPYTLSRKMEYYGQNDNYGNDMHAEDMIVEACQLADADGVDFTPYDNNHDGDIDFVYVIYAGYGEADSGIANAIWPHTYWVKDAAGILVKVDGLYINSYACGNELIYGSRSIQTGIGTFCHEFSHVLGLPDLYNTKNNTNSYKLMGDWDIMDGGSYNNDMNTPPSYSSYERFFLGWLKPTQISGNQSIRLRPLNSGQGAALIANKAHNMKGNDPNPTTFYMLENREKKGWDKYLPGEGMMLTKIQYSYSKWTGNTVNNSSSSLGVDIIEADGITAAKYYDGKEGDLFPTGADSYSQIAGYLLNDIAWSTDKREIRFNLNNGGEILEIGRLSTGIEQNETESVRTNKQVIDGQVVIVRGNEIYNLMGQKIQQ